MAPPELDTARSTARPADKGTDTQTVNPAVIRRTVDGLVAVSGCRRKEARQRISAWLAGGDSLDDLEAWLRANYRMTPPASLPSATRAVVVAVADPGKRTAPGGESGGPDVRLAGDAPTVAPSADPYAEPRCVACGHRVWSAAALRTGLGAECRRRLSTGLASADDAVRIAYAAALLRLTKGAA